LSGAEAERLRSLPGERDRLDDVVEGLEHAHLAGRQEDPAESDAAGGATDPSDRIGPKVVAALPGLLDDASSQPAQFPASKSIRTLEASIR
jgi:hypothetical protein